MEWNGTTYNISQVGGSIQPWEAYAGETYGATEPDAHTFSVGGGWRFCGGIQIKYKYKLEKGTEPDRDDQGRPLVCVLRGQKEYLNISPYIP